MYWIMFHIPPIMYKEVKCRSYSLKLLQSKPPSVPSLHKQQYDFNFTDKFDSKVDIMQEQHGVGVVVDKKSDLFLDGTTVDFYSGLDKRGFMFDNPNAVKSCGCGSSFSA